MVVLFLISAAVCARNGWNKKEEKRNKDLIESVQTIVEEKNIGSFKDVKDHIDAARDSLNQSIKLIPFQGSQQK